MRYFKCAICNSYHNVKEMKTTIIEGKEMELCEECFYQHQDNLAYNLSDGEFIDYEDYMESRGATIVDYHETLKREF